MSLRTKTLLLTLGCIVLFFAVLYGSTQLIILQSFYRLERQQAHRDLNRVVDAINNDRRAISQAVSDWAIWDDSYQFIADGNQEFVQTNLPLQTFVNLKLNLIAFVDPTGRLVFGQFYHEEQQTLESASACLESHLLPNSPLMLRAQSDSSFGGILMTDNGPLLFSAHPILHRSKGGSPRGVLILGRALEDDEFAYYSAITHVVARAFRVDGQDLPEDVLKAKSHLTGFDPWHFQAYDREVAAGYFLLKDYLGQPALILRINFPRELMTEALKTAKVFFYMLLGCSLLFSLLFLILLEKGLISRLTGLNQAVTEIAVGGDLTVRVPDYGRDEVASLAGRINALLATIEKSAYEQKRYAENLEKLFEEVKINESMLRNIFDASPDGIAIADMDGVFLNCNQAALDLQGCSDRSELIGRNLIDQLIPKERARVLAILRDIARQGSLKDFETLFLKKNGKIFECEVSLGAVKGVADQPACLVTIIRDISERKQAEKVLTLSEQRYRLLFERSLAGVYRTSLDGRILEVNDTLMHILGFNSREEMIQCRVQDFYEEGNEREKFLSLLWEKGSISNYQHELLRADGSKAWILENATMLIGEEDEPLIIQGTIIDISDLKKIEDELRRLEERYRQLLESNPTGIFRLSLDPKTLKLQRLDCNEAHARILGYTSRDELMGVDLAKSLGASPEVQAALKQILETKSLLHHEVPLHKKDGSIVWVLANATYAHGEDGMGLIEGTLIDITEWRSTREHQNAEKIKETEEAQRAAMALMAAGLAHNLISPLQGIMNSVEILQLMHEDLPHLDDIMQQAQRLSSMINGIISKTRQEQDLHEQEIDLNRLLIQELDYYGNDLVFKHEIEKSYDFDSRLPTVRGVYCEFSQAFMNIIKNAVDAMHGRDEKRLRVVTQALPEGGIIVEISDSGSGIAPEHVDRIFDPFFTTKPLAGKQDNGEPTGTGLGLSSVKQLLEKYQASIKVDSAPGQGTTFRIHIPTGQRVECNYREIINLPSPEEHLQD